MGFEGTSSDQIIAEAAGYSAEFPDDLANHLPMVLHAMDRLGASTARMAEFARLYTARNRVPAPAGGRPIADGDWRAALGDRAREAALRAHFSGRVAQEGRRAVLAETLPVLSDGVAASATHGLMRLAYALLRDDEAEIGAALGYWAATYLPLPPRPQGLPPAALPDLLARMRADPTFAALAPREVLLWHWIRDIAGRDAFVRLIGHVPEEPDLSELRAAGVALFAGTQSFEALHVVTGAHWLRIVSPWTPQPGRLVARFIDVTLALYPKIGMPEPPGAQQIDALRRSPAPDWDEIAARAVASDDEHDHSLVFSAREEERETQDPVYRRLAALRLGLL